MEQLERELACTKENLQATIEEQQASNEELQSTNEELETSKEELQSLNEELITVNAELQSKIEQLAGMQNDMKNLLDNIRHHLPRRASGHPAFHRDVTRIYRLVATDVDRPLGDVKSEIEDEDLLAKAQTVLNTLVPWEREVRTVRGIWYLVRIQPYRTLDNVIDGVVLTFTDISPRIQAEALAQDARILAESIVDTVREPLVVMDNQLKVISVNRSFCRDFGVAQENTVGHQIYDLGNRQWDIPKLRELLETILPRDQSFDGYVVEHDFSVIGRHKMLLNAHRIVSKIDGAQLILLAIEFVL